MNSPGRAALAGLRIYVQGAVVDFGVNALNLITTNADEAVIADS